MLMLNAHVPISPCPTMTHVHVFDIVTAHALGSELQHPAHTVGALPLWPPCPPIVLVLVLVVRFVFVFVFVFARDAANRVSRASATRTKEHQPASRRAALTSEGGGRTEQSSQKAKTCDSPAPARRVRDEKQRACCDDVGRVHEPWDRGNINASRQQVGGAETATVTGSGDGQAGWQERAIRAGRRVIVVGSQAAGSQAKAVDQVLTGVHSGPQWGRAFAVDGRGRAQGLQSCACVSACGLSLVLNAPPPPPPASIVHFDCETILPG